MVCGGGARVPLPLHPGELCWLVLQAGRRPRPQALLAGAAAGSGEEVRAAQSCRPGLVRLEWSGLLCGRGWHVQDGVGGSKCEIQHEAFCPNQCNGAAVAAAAAAGSALAVLHWGCCCAGRPFAWPGRLLLSCPSCPPSPCRPRRVPAGLLQVPRGLVGPRLCLPHRRHALDPGWAVGCTRRAGRLAVLGGWRAQAGGPHRMSGLLASPPPVSLTALCPACALRPAPRRAPSRHGGGRAAVAEALCAHAGGAGARGGRHAQAPAHLRVRAAAHVQCTDAAGGLMLPGWRCVLCVCRRSAAGPRGACAAQDG